MAAGLMQRRFGRLVWVDSVGLRAGEAIDPFVVETMDEVGVDLSSHRPKSFAELHDGSFDLIVSLTPEAHHRALEYTRSLPIEAEYWPSLDPSLAQGSRAQILAAYRAVRDALDARIEARFQRQSTG
jgi:protein-tyrosine-phosphatase